MKVRTFLGTLLIVLCTIKTRAAFADGFISVSSENENAYAEPLYRVVDKTLNPGWDMVQVDLPESVIPRELMERQTHCIVDYEGKFRLIPPLKIDIVSDLIKEHH